MRKICIGAGLFYLLIAQYLSPGGGGLQFVFKIGILANFEHRSFAIGKTPAKTFVTAPSVARKISVAHRWFILAELAGSWQDENEKMFYHRVSRS